MQTERVDEGRVTQLLIVLAGMYGLLRALRLVVNESTRLVAALHQLVATLHASWQAVRRGDGAGLVLIHDRRSGVGRRTGRDRRQAQISVTFDRRSGRDRRQHERRQKRGLIAVA